MLSKTPAYSSKDEEQEAPTMKEMEAVKDRLMEVFRETTGAERGQSEGWEIVIAIAHTSAERAVVCADVSCITRTTVANALLRD